MYNSKHPKGGIYEMLAIAFPMLVSMGCDAVMTFTDRIFLSRLSTDHMNASLGGGLFLTTLAIFFTGLIGYSTALVAQYLGSGQKHKSANTTFHAILMALASYPILLIMVPIAEVIFANMGLPEKQLYLQMDYLSILLWGSIFMLLRTAFSSFFSGIGKTKYVMIAAVSSMIANVGLNYVLIFGKFGMPKLGIKGAAIGTIIGSAIGVLILISVYFGKRVRESFETHRKLSFNWDILKKLLWFGFPQGIEHFLCLAAFTTLTFIFHSEGEVVATASTIMFNWDYVSFMPLIGVEIGVTSLVGKYIGAGDIKSATKSAMSGVKTGLIYSALIFVLYVFVPGILVNMFKPDGDLTVFNKAFPIAVNMLRVATIYVLADAILVAMVGALRGAGDTHWTMMAAVFVHWLAVALLYIAIKVLKLNAVMGWAAVVSCFLLFCIIFIIRFRQGKWKSMKVID